MNEAISEVKRRKEKQLKYNEENGIDPKNIVREISEEVLNFDYGLDLEEKESGLKKVYKSKEEIEKEIKALEKEIKKLSKELDFEKAIEKRDEMKRLKQVLLEV